MFMWTVAGRTVAFCARVCCPVCGPIEADPEYQLIVEANNVTAEIDNEISEFFYLR